MEISTPVERSEKLGWVLWRNAKVWGLWWFALTAVGVRVSGHAVAAVVWEIAYWLSPYALVCFVVDLLIWRWPWLVLNRFTDRLLNAITIRPPERAEAWSARVAVTFLVVCGLFFQIVTASDRWVRIPLGLLVSVAVGVILWMLMSWAEVLTERAKTRAQRRSRARHRRRLRVRKARKPKASVSRTP